MRGRAALVFCPGGLAVALGCRSDDGRVDQRAFAHASALSFKIARDRRKQTLIEPVRYKQAPKAHKRRALGGFFVAGKAAKAPKAPPLRKRLADRAVATIIPDS